MSGKEDVDEDRATKPVNPVVDHGLGLLFGLLILQYAKHIWDNREIQPELGPWVAATFVGTVFAIKATVSAAGAFGQWFSKRRVGKELAAAGLAEPLKSKIAQKKFGDQAWQLAVHLSMAAWEWRLIGQNPQWWEDPGTAFDAPGQPDSCINDWSIAGGIWPFELRLFYMVQLAIWIWTGVSCKWLEERRKDYIEMMLHHVLTVALVLNSFVFNELPIGMIILFIHDASDVVLDVMKMANYLKLEGPHGFFITEIFFVLNTYGSWIYLRLYVYPVYVLTGTLWGYHARCSEVAPGNPLADPHMLHLAGTRPRLGSWSQASAMLVGLQLMHVFWFYLLNRIAYKMVLGTAPNEAGDQEYEITMKDKKKE